MYSKNGKQGPGIHACNPSCAGSIDRKIEGLAGLGKKGETQILKK
jgi:hypothetical protein